jgi:eukaryotic-like serine/threonine-protein kinase
VKLTDFGIAKMMGEPTLTLNEQLFGTPGYIAPEYVSGLPIDGRADIYSLVVVLYEMITGQLPFEGRGQSDLLLKPLTTAPIPPGRRVQGLPPDLESLILGGLARDPRDRPHDAFALHDRLLDIMRRWGGTQAQGALRGSEPPFVAREPIETIVDRTSAPHAVARETANLGDIVTSEMNARWASALTDLETKIARARAKGGDMAAARRASDFALVASELIPRVERAANLVSERQAKTDRLEAAGREFRANLGYAIDVLVHDRSRERAHLDALRARRAALQRDKPRAPTASDPRPWEIEALAGEEQRAERVVEDLSFQITALQKQLDARNEAHELELVQATGALEGSLSALRRLSNELARTIDDGLRMLS